MCKVCHSLGLFVALNLVYASWENCALRENNAGFDV